MVRHKYKILNHLSAANPDLQSRNVSRGSRCVQRTNNLRISRNRPNEISGLINEGNKMGSLPLKRVKNTAVTNKASEIPKIIWRLGRSISSWRAKKKIVSISAASTNRMMSTPIILTSINWPHVFPVRHSRRPLHISYKLLVKVRQLFPAYCVGDEISTAYGRTIRPAECSYATHANV